MTEPAEPSLEQSTEDIESEVLVLLLMSSESAIALQDMFTDSDQQKLQRLGGSTEAGLSLVLSRLVSRKLITVVDPLAADDEVWKLTPRGEVSARQLVDQTEQA